MKPYITPEYEHNLLKNTYKPLGSTKLDSIFDKFLWSPVATILPRWLHPNVLTLIAFLFSVLGAFFPTFLFNYDGKSVSPRYIYLISAISIFLYQLLDAIDGKQARNLKIASPVGQLFDHGCDAITTFYMLYTALSASQFGFSANCVYIITAITCQLFVCSWYEYEFEKFKTNIASTIGITEGQLLLILLNMICFARPGVFAFSLVDIMPRILANIFNFPPFNINLTTIVFYIVFTFVYCLEAYELYNILSTCKFKNPKASAGMFVTLLIHMFCQFHYFWNGAIERHMFGVTFIVAIFGANICWRFMLASIAKCKPVLIDAHTVLFYLVGILLALPIKDNIWETIIIYTMCVYTFIYMIGFVYVNLKMTKRVLNISLFVVPPAHIQITQEDKQVKKKPENKTVSLEQINDPQLTSIVNKLELVNLESFNTKVVESENDDHNVESDIEECKNDNDMTKPLLNRISKQSS